MEEISKIFRENIVLEESLLVSGMVNGDIHIKAGGSLELEGIMKGRLTVEEDAKAELMGIVTGEVINNGGYIYVRGIIKGRLFEEKGETVIHPKAIIKED